MSLIRTQHAIDSSNNRIFFENSPRLARETSPYAPDRVTIEPDRIHGTAKESAWRSPKTAQAQLDYQMKKLDIL